MGLPCYLAVTAAEFPKGQGQSPCLAWMACHFSSGGTGLSNLPQRLPPSSMLILDDSIPFAGHDPQRITAQLQEAVDAMDCACLLLDLQRPGSGEVAALCGQLTQTLRCPVIVSEHYAKALSCPVFLPPPPLFTPLQDYLAPWQGRDIWLEAAQDRCLVMVTEAGSSRFPCQQEESPEPWFFDERLFCRYRWSLEGRTARFTVMRTRQELDTLLEKAEALGVTGAVGLYQEFN